MATIEKRIIRREITQRLVLPLDLDLPIKEQCERILVKRLQGTPSEWGVMVDSHLLDIRVGEYTEPISYGTRVMMSIPVKASYEVVGYLPGDVLFGVGLAEKLADDPAISQFRNVDIVGLPFVIEVRTRSQVSTMNIQIVDMRTEGTLQFIAVPSFYPYYAPLMAHLGSGKSQSTSLYAETPLPAMKGEPTPMELRLIDPLAEMPPDMRKRRIVGEIRRALSLIPTAATPTPSAPSAAPPAPLPDEAKEGAGKPVKTAAVADSVAVINSTAPFDGKAPLTKRVADAEHPIVIEFIEIKDIAKKATMLADSAHYTFIHVPSIPPLATIVAVVSWTHAASRILNPTKEQIAQFTKDVEMLIKFRKLEIAANRDVYGAKLLAGSEAKGPEAQLLRDHLDAGARLAAGLAIETVTEKDAKVAKAKALDKKAYDEGGPQRIAVREIAPRGRGRGRGRGSRIPI